MDDDGSRDAMSMLAAAITVFLSNSLHTNNLSSICMHALVFSIVLEKQHDQHASALTAERLFHHESDMLVMNAMTERH